MPLKIKNEEKIPYKLKFIDTKDLCQVYDKECKKCMERKKIRLNCKFIGFKNGRLNYKCKESKKSYPNVANRSIKIFQLYINFAMVMLISFF